MPLLRSCAFAGADFGSSGLVTFSFAGSNPRYSSISSASILILPYCITWEPVMYVWWSEVLDLTCTSRLVFQRG